jgi:hypothetical protein
MSKEFQPLEIILNKYFKFNPLRTKCLAQLILCMTKLKTVNLSKICQAMKSKAKTESNYRRLQRFIVNELIPQKSFAKLIVAIKGLNKQKTWKLTMDRTNWKFGKTHINILYLGICYNNVAIPLFSHFFPQRRNVAIVII